MIFCHGFFPIPRVKPSIFSVKCDRYPCIWPRKKSHPQKKNSAQVSAENSNLDTGQGTASGKHQGWNRNPLKCGYTPQNLTWNPKMKAWKMFFLFKWVIFRFHVSFLGCKLNIPTIHGSYRVSMPQGNPFHGKQRMSKNDYNFDVLVWWLGKIWKQRQKMVPNGDESHGGIREKPPTKQAKVKEPKWILGDITRNLRHNSSTLSSVWVVWKFQS